MISRASPYIRLRVFAWVFLRIVAGYRFGPNEHLLTDN